MSVVLQYAGGLPLINAVALRSSVNGNSQYACGPSGNDWRYAMGVSAHAVSNTSVIPPQALLYRASHTALP